MLKMIICNGAQTAIVKAIKFLHQFQSLNGNLALVVFFM